QLEDWKKMRAEPRVPISFEVQIEDRSQIGKVSITPGTVYDVSRHGAAVWVGRPYETDQRVQLIGPEQKFSVPALVRNCTNEGEFWRIGLRLLFIPEQWVIR